MRGESRMGEWEQTRQAYLPLRASYKKTHQPILPTTNHPIFSSCVVPLYPSYLLQTHSSLSLSLSLSLQCFATWLYRNIWLISLKKKNTKTTVKVSVRCIFIHSRTQLYGGPLRIQESLSRGGPYSCNLQGLWLFVISLIVFVWSSREIKNKFFLIVWKMFGKRNCPFYCHCVII